MSLVNGDHFDDPPLELQVESGWIEEGCEVAATEYIVARCLELIVDATAARDDG